MKKLVLPLLISTAAFAAKYDNCPQWCGMGAPQSEDPCEPLFVETCQTFVSAEFLYWTAEEASNDYAIKMDCGTTAAETFAIGDYKVSDYSYCPGARVTLGWYNRPRLWEANAQYTWLYADGSDSAISPFDGVRFLNPTWGATGIPPFSSASSNIELHYQLGDLYVARVFDPNPHLRIRFLGGATIAYLEQDWKIHYVDALDFTETLKSDWHFIGGGLRLGTTIDWYWGNSFFFTGRATLATLVGSYKNRAHQVTFDDVVVRNSLLKDTRFAAQIQYLLGPSWQRVCDCWSVEIFAGYEFNLWFNLHETYRSSLGAPELPKITNNSNGLFGLHGLTVRATFGF